jgi:superfamily II DNA helicase RecQ
MKSCPKCRELKDQSCFYNDESKVDRLSSYCKECSKKKRMARYADNKEEEKKAFRQHYQVNKEQSRRYSLKALYGLSLEEYNEMREEQMFSCLICKTHEDDTARGLFVDHCHDTGKVRGLLCQHCNTMLGMAKDNQLILQEAIKYLARM